MKALYVSKVKFSEVLSQVLEELRPKFLDMFRVILEQELQAIRDRIIRTRRYVRGNVKKRWGYTVRKWIQTPLGTLEQVRIPRIREVQHEVSLFCDQYVKRSGEISAVLLEMFLWGLSSRRCSVMSQKLFRSGLSANGISLLKRLVMSQVIEMRTGPISSEIKILVVDGVHGKYRGVGRGVCLLAIGVDETGKAHLLDWLGCQGESRRNWKRLFRRLRARGLQKVHLVVSDDRPEMGEAIERVWGKDCAHQLCLWHISQEIKRGLTHRARGYVRQIMRDFWEVFDGLDLSEATTRWDQFVKTWSLKEPKTIEKFKEKKDHLFLYYAYPGMASSVTDSEPGRRILFSSSRTSQKMARLDQ